MVEVIVQENKPLYSARLLLTLIMGLGLVMTQMSCVGSSRFVIDSQSYQAQGKNQRISSIVLHYTAEDEEESIRLLTTANVSAHYLIPLTQNNKIYQLVADNERAWHAGSGEFAGRRVLNDTSIGIEIVNEGIKKEFRKTRNSDNNGYHPSEHFVEFSDIQVQKLAQLISSLTKKYQIEPTQIIGHSDMAPSRKIDPGAKFPWERLYKEYGIGAWYDDVDKQHFMTDGSFETATVAEIKQLLKDYGYAINDSDKWDKASRNVVYAFQLHFRPQQIDAKMDLETYAILKALSKKYVEAN
ncbi:N-acetylmuramoyl-L-alanine amidase [Psychrobacter sp.]|uniref:N-acetylmuramoyl-L-alanine amidase n=1 Tax=Psychrobacter sp. TaxID=56811 RepID=UPI0025E30EDC|nr:N-acetylmuramoyl-L-alanine amidase [Psychrobacter sp.]